MRVVAAVVRGHGRYLVCQRPPHKRHGGLWEFPGGKLELGESDAHAIARELQEELGVDVVSVGEPEFELLDPGSHYLIVFLPVEIEGEPECREHAALYWVTPDGLRDLPLAPSDRQYVEHLRVSGSTSG
jgi:mutator protein MutT